MKIHLSLISIIFIFLIASCSEPEKVVFTKYQIKGEAQGTYYSITYFDSLNRELKIQFDSLLTAFDMSASNYQEQSILSKVNRNEEVVLDDIFIGNYQLAMEVAEMTHGDFDITVRPLVEAWGFGKKDPEDMNPEIVDSILQFVGYKTVSLKDGKIIKLYSRTQLDFDALAQGYSVDVLVKYLQGLGIRSYLVDVGGEVFASKEKIDSTLWHVGIEQPKENAGYGEELSAILPLSEKGMATSGNYRKFYVKDGVKYAHTINPHTGYPIAQTLLSTTVIASSAAKADAYATAFMVMGLEKTKEFVAQHPELDVYLIYSDSVGEYQYFATDNVMSVLGK